MSHGGSAGGRVFLIGLVWFTVASLLCARATPTALVLVAARVLQGVGGAVLTPASLGILEGVFTLGARLAASDAGRHRPSWGWLQAQLPRLA